MNAPEIAWIAIAPICIPFAAAVLGVLIETFVPAKSRRTIQLGLALLASAGSGTWALVLALSSERTIEPTFGGHLLIDPFALYVQAIAALCAFLAVFLLADRTVAGQDAFTPLPASAPGSADEKEASGKGRVNTTSFPLLLFASGGLALFCASGDLLTMFVALEVLSLPLYIMTALARHRRLLSHEASLKYFLLGAFSSAFFLFGVAWVYGATGVVGVREVAKAVQGFSQGTDPILFTGLIFILVGLAFKVGAVPFHMWVPDVYQGAPLPVTAFMASAVKVAAFGALIRIVYTIVYPLHVNLAPALWTIAIATMVVGTVVAMTQRDVVRMLAFSAIAHAGFLLIGVTSLTMEGLTACLFYMLAYGVSTIGAFSIASVIRLRLGVVGPGALSISSWNGLGRRSPALATMMAFFLLSFAGIPLTSGFVGKFSLFASAFAGDAAGLAIVGIVCSAAALLFYARLIIAMFFKEPDESLGAGERTRGLTGVTIGVAGVATLVLGVWPGPFLDFAAKAAALLT